MIAWGFVGIRIVLPARLKLPVPGSDHQDFTQQTSSWANPKLMASTWCLSVFGRLVEIHFDLFEWSLFVWDLTAFGFALVSKEWYTKHGMMEKSKIVVRITRHFRFWLLASRVSFQRNLSGNCLSGSKKSVTKYGKNCSIKCYLWPKLL